MAPAAIVFELVAVAVVAVKQFVDTIVGDVELVCQMVSLAVMFVRYAEAIQITNCYRLFVEIAAAAPKIGPHPNQQTVDAVQLSLILHPMLI